MYILQIALFLSYCGYIWCSDCDSVSDCITCVSKGSWGLLFNMDISCRWCPLTGKCHAYGSPYNPCPSKKIVDATAYCYEKPSGVYDPENAYINVLMSAVAYSDHPQQCIDHLLPGGGFQLIKAIGMKCNEFFFEYKECYAVVAVSEYSKLIVVAFRGTTSLTQLLDEIATSFFPKKDFKSGGSVQKYFKDAFKKLYPCAKDSVKELFESKPDYDIVITGHSLGGAMASLMAVSLIYDKIIPEERMSLYSFGMPRVGNERYALSHDRLVKNSWRVVHYKDYVTRVPMRVADVLYSQPYHHKTEVFYPGGRMLPSSTYRVCTINEDPTCVNSIDFEILKAVDNLKYHLNYFGINVGKECSNIGARRKRSTDGSEISAMSGMFSNETCKIIDLVDVVSKSQSTTQQECQLMITLLVLASLVYA